MIPSQIMIFIKASLEMMEKFSILLTSEVGVYGLIIKQEIILIHLC